MQSCVLQNGYEADVFQWNYQGSEPALAHSSSGDLAPERSSFSSLRSRYNLSGAGKLSVRTVEPSHVKQLPKTLNAHKGSMAGVNMPGSDTFKQPWKAHWHISSHSFSCQVWQTIRNLTKLPRRMFSSIILLHLKSNALEKVRAGGELVMGKD